MALDLFSRTRSFAYGVTLPARSARLILSQKRLLALSLLPVSLTLLLYFFLIRNLQQTAEAALTAQMVGWGFNLEGFGAWLILLAAKIGIFILAAMTFSIVASVVGSPFNDFLAEQAERFTDPPMNVAPALPWSAKLRLIWIDLVKGLFAGIAAIAALLLSWVPGLNLVAFALSFLLLTFQYVSYPQTRRNLPLREGVAFLARHPFACVGFGLAMSFLFAIPVVSAFCLPLAVVGGTLLAARAPGSAGGMKALK